MIFSPPLFLSLAPYLLLFLIHYLLYLLSFFRFHSVYSFSLALSFFLSLVLFFYPYISFSSLRLDICWRTWVLRTRSPNYSRTRACRGPLSSSNNARIWRWTYFLLVVILSLFLSRFEDTSVSSHNNAKYKGRKYLFHFPLFLFLLVKTTSYSVKDIYFF